MYNFAAQSVIHLNGGGVEFCSYSFNKNLNSGKFFLQNSSLSLKAIPSSRIKLQKELKVTTGISNLILNCFWNDIESKLN